MLNKIKTNKSNKILYYTQKELADRWRVSPSTIKSYRDHGDIPYFSPPGSSKILYPADQIRDIELENSIPQKKEVVTQKKALQQKRNKPVDPTESNRVWRI